LLVGFSAVADLGMGLPIGEAARTAMVAVNLARGVGCTESDVSDVYYAALLQHIGCTAYAREVTELFADEFSIKRAGLATDFTRPSEIALTYLPRITRESPPGERLRTLRSALLHSRRMTEGYMLANCETASIIAGRIGLPQSVGTGLLDIFEWWNGRGRPKRARGEQISLVARLPIQLVDYFAGPIPFLSGVSPGRFGARRGWLPPGWSRRSCGRSVQRGCGRSSRSGPTGWRSPDS